MALNSWTFIDKSAWKEGPWNQEPDRLEWIDEATGLFCLILRKPSGALSGHVGVPSDHPFFLKPHHLLRLWVHHGISYSNFSHGQGESSIRYFSDLAAPNRIWWFGFSCDYEDDLCPARLAPRGHYRNIDYVMQEVINLAEQIRQRLHKQETVTQTVQRERILI